MCAYTAYKVTVTVKTRMMTRDSSRGQSAPAKASSDSKGAGADNGVELHCQRCNWRWHYTGRHSTFVSCPDCYGKVRIPENVK